MGCLGGHLALFLQASCPERSFLVDDGRVASVVEEAADTLLAREVWARDGSLDPFVEEVMAYIIVSDLYSAHLDLQQTERLCMSGDSSNKTLKKVGTYK